MVLDDLTTLLRKISKRDKMPDEDIGIVFKNAEIYINENKTGLFERRGDPTEHTQTFSYDHLSLIMYGLLCDDHNLWERFVHLVKSIDIDPKELHTEIYRSLIYLQKNMPHHAHMLATKARMIGSTLSDQIIKYDEPTSYGHIIPYLDDREIMDMIEEHITKTLFMTPQKSIDSDEIFGKTIGKSINPKLYTFTRQIDKSGYEKRIEAPPISKFIYELYHVHMAIENHHNTQSQTYMRLEKIKRVFKNIILNMLPGTSPEQNKKHPYTDQNFKLIQKTFGNELYNFGRESCTAFDYLIRAKEYDIAIEILRKYKIDMNHVMQSNPPIWFNIALKADESEQQELIKMGANINLTSAKNGSNELLNHAIKQGAIHLVKDLINKLGVNLDEHSHHYFELACTNGRTDIVSFFIEKGVDIHKNFLSGTYLNAVFCAAENGYLDLFHLLLKNGAKLTGRDVRNYNVLHCAVDISRVVTKKNHSDTYIVHEAEKITIVRTIINHHSDLINELNLDALTPLMLALELYFEKAAIILINNQAKGIRETLNAANEKDQLIFYAAEFGCAGVIMHLSKIDDHTDAINASGETPLFVAAENNFIQALPITIPKDTQEHYLDNHLPIAESSFDHVINALLSIGVNINHQDHDGVTAVMHEVSVNSDTSFDKIKSMVAHNADCDIASDGGRTALHDAVELENLDIVALLIKHTSNINSPDAHGANALYYAIPDTTLLIDEDGPIHLEVQIKVMNILLDNGADPLMFNNNENHTPLSRSEEVLTEIENNENSGIFTELSDETVDKFRNTITRMQSHKPSMSP